MRTKLFIAGLAMAFGFLAVSSDAEARHYRRARCCQAWNVRYQNSAAYQQPVGASGITTNDGQAGFQDGRYQSGYRGVGIDPTPAPEFQGQPLNNDPTFRVQSQQDLRFQQQQGVGIQSQQNLRVQPQQDQRGTTQPPQERQQRANDQRTTQPRNDRAPQNDRTTPPEPATKRENDETPKP